MEVSADGFGQVQDGRVTFNLKKGWFSGRMKADYPTQHNTSVSLETSRRPIWGMICGIIAIIALSNLSAAPNPFGPIFTGLLCLALAAYLLLGRPAIHFATAGGELIISCGSWPWKKTEAQEFVNAIQNEVFGKGKE